jgi:hypothetical protein
MQQASRLVARLIIVLAPGILSDEIIQKDSLFINQK